MAGVDELKQRDVVGPGGGCRPRNKRAPAAGAASAVLGACMFGGGILVSPLIAPGGEGSAVPMAAVVAIGAVAALAALAATAVLTRGDHPEPSVAAAAAVSAEPIEE